MSDADGSPAPGPAPERVEALSNRLDALRTKVGRLEDDLDAERERREELEAELERRDHRIDDLEQRLAEIDRRTDLLSFVQGADDADGEQRSAALLLHLKREAEQSNGRAAVDRDGAARALHHPDVERTTIYRDMERVARWVGNDDVCAYDDGTLRLNLDAGALPEDALSRLPEVERQL